MVHVVHARVDAVSGLDARDDAQSAETLLDELRVRAFVFERLGHVGCA
jgi:hypothetical protein